MAKVAFLLLAHCDPARLIAKARALTVHGDPVTIHFDARASTADWRQLHDGLAENPNVAFAPRIRCGWGEFSLVRATLGLIRTARKAFGGITHYYLISGDCYPTKTRGYLDRYLADDRDIVEAADFHGSGWIRTGLKEDRLIYRHWFNERKRKRLFYASLEFQRRLRLARKVPTGLKMRIGSQWWVLRAGTVERLLALLGKRRDITRFFRTTWIPDETFFQTLVAHLVPEAEIAGHPPTHLKFSDYGMPVVFYRNHGDYLRAEAAPFARKISVHADVLHRELLDRFRSWDDGLAEGGTASGLYGYLAGRGRDGRRYAPRFWERAIGQRRRSELLIVAAKLWHVGRAVEASAAAVTGIRRLGYLYTDTNDLDLPLGGLEHGLAKRNRHRHALLNLVFDTMATDRLMICIDTSQADAIDEMMRNIGEVRILLVERPVGHDHIRGHALRAGLISPSSGEFEEREALAALRHEFRAEADHLRDTHGHHLFTNTLERDREANMIDIGRFLRTDRASAGEVAREAEKWKF